MIFSENRSNSFYSLWNSFIFILEFLQENYIFGKMKYLSITVLGEAVLSVLGCLIPFLEYDLLDSLPYTFASTLATFPACLHKDTVDLLCTNLLPMTLG